jgi:hypothetical protein
MFLKVFFHLIPLVGVGLQRVNLTVGLLLLVALPYIKVKKLESVIDGKSNEDKSAQDTGKTLLFWKKFTFLK